MSSSVSGNMKGFYKQKKNPITTTTANKSSKSRKPPIHTATSTSNVALASRNANPDLQDDEANRNEEVLRQFDMNMWYGPTTGMTRLERWERAVKFGLNPPQEVGELLKSGRVQQENQWHNRI